MTIANSGSAQENLGSVPDSQASIDSILWATGWGLLGAGVVSLVTTFIPLELGNIDWEFGTFGEFAATTSLPLMGIGLVAAMALRRGTRWSVVLCAVCLVVLSLASALSLFILMTDLPLIWNATAPAGGLQITAQAFSVRIAFIKAVGISVLLVTGVTLSAGYQVRNLLLRERSRHV